MFNLNYGDNYYGLPGWFDWLSYLTTFFGFIAAIIIYFWQKRDSANSAFEMFQVSLGYLDTAIDETMLGLEEFKISFLNVNDNFVKPNFPAAFNDKFLNNIEIISLIRFYKNRRSKKLDVLKIFLGKSGFIGGYFALMLSEVGYFRLVFAQKEAVFKQHSHLFTTKLTEIVISKYEPRDEKFIEEYCKLYKDVAGKREIITGEHLIINRTALNNEFIKPLAELAGMFAKKDIKANEVFKLAHEIDDARSDMDNFKKEMIDFMNNSLIGIREIKEMVKSLKEK